MIWREPSREARQIAWLWLVAATSTAILLPLFVALTPFTPRCPFHVITGIPCPSCGATRAGLALLSGHPILAFRLNPLATLGEVAFLAGGALAPLWIQLGGRVPALPRRWPVWMRLAAGGVILLNWAWLIAHGV